MSSEQVSIANVTFEPDCRNHWHIHHGGGQILLCTAGNGYYQEWGKDIVELHAGDVVNIPAEVKQQKIVGFRILQYLFLVRMAIVNG